MDDEYIVAKRCVRLCFRGRWFTITVRSVEEEVEAHISAWTRSRLAATGQIEELPYESTFAVDAHAARKDEQTATVEDEVAAPVIRGRGELADMLEGEDWTSSREMTEHILRIQPVLEQMDQGMRVECEHILAMGGDMGMEVIHEDALKLFPTRYGDAKPVAVLSDLRRIQNRAATKFAPFAAIKDLEVVVGFLEAVDGGRPVRMAKDTMQTPFLLSVIEKLPNFVNALVDDPGPPATKKQLVGKEALVAIFDAWSAKLASAAATVDPAEVDVFNTFHWLLTADQSKAVKNYEKHEIERVARGPGAAIRVGPLAPGGSGAAASSTGLAGNGAGSASSSAGAGAVATATGAAAPAAKKRVKKEKKATAAKEAGNDAAYDNLFT